jgi:sugar phosphate isomerase/epimerase
MAKRPHLSIVDTHEETLHVLKAELKQQGIRCIGLACYNDILLKAPAEVPIIEMQLAYLESAARITAELGGSLIRVFTGYWGGEPSYGKARERILDFLGETGRRAARYGITVAVQNHHDFGVDTLSIAAILDDIGLPKSRRGGAVYGLEDCPDDCSELCPPAEVHLHAGAGELPEGVS